MKLRNAIALFNFWLMAFLVGCVPRPEKEVVIYTSADREYALPILEAFERDHDGLQVSRQFDVEASKTLGLVTRIMEESPRARCDVFWNNEVLHTIRLRRAGLLRTRRWKIPDSWPPSMRASDGTWVGFASRARVLLINRTKLPDPSTWPRSVLELADPKWKGNCGHGFPVFGTTATHFSVLASQMGEAEGDAWFQKVASNAIVLAGNKQVALSVSAGQIAWGLTDTDDAAIEIQNGHPVEFIFPDQGQDQSGTLFIPNTVCVIQLGPHPNISGQLADYLVSQSVEGRLTTDGSSHYPTWPENHRNIQRKDFDRVRWMEVDFEKAADHWDRLSTKFPTWFK